MSFKKLWNGWTVLLVAAIVFAVYLLVLYPWMMRWGATDAEVALPLSGDELVPVVGTDSTRAITVQAPAADVWKWVVQLGQERAGFYSNDWLENLTLADIHNGDEIQPDWQTRQVGDFVLGAGGPVYGTRNGWRIQAYEPGKLMYLWGTIAVQPIDANSSRLITRTRAAPAPLYADLISRLSYDWMHFVMERGMLLGIKARAEGTSGSTSALSLLSSFGWIAATIGIFAFLVMRRSAWLLLPLAYAAGMLWFTHDVWSAMAGFLWWGIIIVGFVAFGRAWWKGLTMLILLVILVFVLAPFPQNAFGLLFMAAVLIAAAMLMVAPRVKGRGTISSDGTAP